MSSLSIFSDYPPSAFYFKVVFGTTLGLTDTSFQEVSGIGAEVEVETVSEGGENRYQHKLPKGIKHPNLELKRGIASMASQASCRRFVCAPQTAGVASPGPPAM